MSRISLHMSDSGRIPVKSLYAVEVAGACNLDHFCSWCPMISRPRSRKRGLMRKEETVVRSLHWVEKLEKIDALALHVFGEPLLHPKFDEIAARFAALTPITMSTNGLLLDDNMADRLAKVSGLGLRFQAGKLRKPNLLSSGYANAVSEQSCRAAPPITGLGKQRMRINCKVKSTAHFCITAWLSSVGTAILPIAVLATVPKTQLVMSTKNLKKSKCVYTTSATPVIIGGEKQWTRKRYTT